MFCCRLGSFECVFVDIVCVCVYIPVRAHLDACVCACVCASLAGCCFCMWESFVDLCLRIYMQACACVYLCSCACVCLHLRILSMKVHPSIMWAWRSIQAHVIPNQLLGSSLALHWSSSELIFQPSDILCVAWGNNRSCSHQMCYVIDVTGSFAAHVMGALFHSHCLLPHYIHTETHTHTSIYTLPCPNVPHGACVFSREASVFPWGSSIYCAAGALLHIVHSQS